MRGKPDDPAWVRPALLGAARRDRPCSTSGVSARPAGPTRSTRPRCRPARRAGRRSSSARPTPPTSSPSTSRPASLWVMELSARIFGVNSWSILVPQALEGVAAVGVLYATVRRWFRPGAALHRRRGDGAHAGRRVDVPVQQPRRAARPAADARRLRDGPRARSRPHPLARARVRHWSASAFLAKMLQAFLVLPAFGLVYLLAAPAAARPAHRPARVGRRRARRVGRLVGGDRRAHARRRRGRTSAGRPDNSVLNLIFGYNGFGRLTGNETGSVGGGAPGRQPVGRRPGLGRLFGTEMGGQVSWLLPAALILLVAGIVTRRRRRAPTGPAPRCCCGAAGCWSPGSRSASARGSSTRTTRSPWLRRSARSSASASSTWWRRRQRARSPAPSSASRWLRTAVWAVRRCCDRTPTWMPWLSALVLVAGLAVAAAARWRVPRLRGRHRHGRRRRRARASRSPDRPRTRCRPRRPPHRRHPVRRPGEPASGFGGPGGARGGLRQVRARRRPALRPVALRRLRRARSGVARRRSGPAAARPGRWRPVAAGGLLNGSTAAAALVTLLQTNAGSYTWVAAAVGSNQAAGYQLATGKPVMAIGGFNGSDPTPTLAQFKQYVAAGGSTTSSAAGSAGSAGSGVRRRPAEAVGASAPARPSTLGDQHLHGQDGRQRHVYDLTRP